MEVGVDIQTGKHVLDMDPEKLLLTFVEGTTHQAQFLIGTDGVHSDARQAIHPDYHPYLSPFACSRFLLDREEVKKQLESDHYHVVEDSKPCYWEELETMVLMYPTLQNTKFNFVAHFLSKYWISSLSTTYNTARKQVSNNCFMFSEILILNFSRS